MTMLDTHDMQAQETQHERERRRRRHDTSADRVARGLGWFSIGLGLLELFTGRSLANAVGLRNFAPVIRIYGVREIGTGAGLLLRGDPTPWMWARVAGDVLDLVTLAPAVGRRPVRGGSAVVIVSAVTLIDLLVALTLSDKERRPLVRDYSGRAGFPRTGPRGARGIRGGRPYRRNEPQPRTAQDPAMAEAVPMPRVAGDPPARQP